MPHVQQCFRFCGWAPVVGCLLMRARQQPWVVPHHVGSSRGCLIYSSAPGSVESCRHLLATGDWEDTMGKCDAAQRRALPQDQAAACQVLRMFVVCI